ncbi:hypothetical protein BG46_01470 [Brucella anthropi]|uniref:phage tail length tape measure family protein n=1 Tax=Brucella anthropi TaxID=529 RepID=UPI00045228EB|nr:phage tail length tape measure family protein [Brucella anthropi]EXL08575.1 hypothetical protein BG46_01470 [Brucella anthropi]
MATSSAYKLGIVISADASSVRPAVAETKTELASIGTAAAATETKMQKLIATATGMHTGAANSNQREWAGALAAEGLALDNLRSKYNPMFAVIRQYKAAQTEIRTAHAMGALSADEMTAALQRQRQAALASIDAIKGRNSRSGNGSGHNMAATNAMFQFQDIGVTAAMGMNPAMIAMQQGSQLAGGFAGMNMKQVGASLVDAFSMLLSPVSLATVAVTGLTAAAIQYAMTWSGNAKTLSQTIEEHEAQIKSLHDAYQYAGTAAEAYFQRINAGQFFQSSGNRKQLEKTVNTGSNQMLGQLGMQSTGNLFIDAYGTIPDDAQWMVHSPYKDFEAAILHLQKTAKDGKPDILGFRQMVEERWSLDRNNEGLSKTAKELLEMGTEATAAALRLEQLKEARARFMAQEAQRRAGEYSSSISSLRGIAAPQLSDRRQVEDTYATAYGNAGDRDERADALKQRDEALARVNAQEARQIQLAQIDIQLQTARDPLTRADLTAKRERIQLSGMEIDATEAETRVLQARNQVIAEALAQSSAQVSDMRADVEARRNVNDAIAAGTINAADAQTYLQAETQLRPLITAAAKAEGAEKQKLTEQINAQTAAYQALAEEQRRASALSYLQSQKDNIASLQVQLAVVGETETVQKRVIAQLEAEQKIRQLGLQTSSEMADKIREQAGREAELTAQLEKQADAWGKIRQTGEDTIDTIFDGLSSGDFDIKSIAADLFSDFSKTWLELSVKNPLKNALFGTNYGTMDDVGGISGIISKLFGGGQVDGSSIIKSALGNQSVGAMTVTAATVMVNGGVTGGVGGLLGLGSGSAANSNTLTGDIASMAKVIKGMESSNNYSALGPVLASGDRAYGAYQVMGANVPNWTKSALGYSMTPGEFLKSSSAQDAVFNKVFGGYVGKYGASGAAQAWFGGPGSVGSGGNAADILGTTGTEYVSKFNAGLQQLSATTGSATGAIGNLGSGLNTASTGLNQLGNGFNNFGQQLSGFASGGGGFSLGSLFPGAGGFQSQQLANAIQSGVGGLWSDGGYTGPGGVYEPKGIVHAGEVVWSQRDVARAGGVHVVEGMRLGYRGYDSGGVVGVTPLPPVAQSAANSNRQANMQSSGSRAANFHFHLDGARGDKEIEDAAYRGMQMALTEYDNMLPDRVAGINQNPEWR